MPFLGLLLKSVGQIAYTIWMPPNINIHGRLLKLHGALGSCVNCKLQNSGVSAFGSQDVSHYPYSICYPTPPTSDQSLSLSVWQTRGPHKVLPMCSRLLGRLPSDETPGVSSLGCALVAVRACLLVLLCCVHPTKFLTPYLPYPPSYLVSDTRDPHVLVYRSSNQPDVAGMMSFLLLLPIQCACH
jgi:hypothetical protein